MICETSGSRKTGRLEIKSSPADDPARLEHGFADGLEYLTGEKFPNVTLNASEKADFAREIRQVFTAERLLLGKVSSSQARK
jgi:hypothetical protein